MADKSFLDTISNFDSDELKKKMKAAADKAKAAVSSVSESVKSLEDPYPTKTQEQLDLERRKKAAEEAAKRFKNKNYHGY